MGHSYVVTVAFVQLCEEMLEREGMERKGKVWILGGFCPLYKHATTQVSAIMSGCGWW